MRGSMGGGGKGRALRGYISSPPAGRAQRWPHRGSYVPRALVLLTTYSPYYRSHLAVQGV